MLVCAVKRNICATIVFKYQSINQSIQFYIALLYIPEVALQSPESSSHTHTVIPVVVSYLSSHSCPGADWQKRGCQSAPTAPPTTTNIHSYSHNEMHVFMMIIKMIMKNNMTAHWFVNFKMRSNPFHKLGTTMKMKCSSWNSRIGPSPDTSASCQ